MTVVEEIIKWCKENACHVESQAGIKYISIDFEDMREHFDEWKKKEKEQLHDAFIEGYRGEV